MPRQIVYPRAVVASTSRVRKGKVKLTAPPAHEPEKPTDGYRDKLVKYVPVEATVFFALAYGKLVDDLSVDKVSDRLWWVVILALAALIAVLFATTATGGRDPLPWYFYVLTSLAFLCWAFGTTGIGQELIKGWLVDANDIVLAAAAFIIPGIDEWFTRRRQQAAA
jgi:hypothetical protein